MKRILSLVLIFVFLFALCTLSGCQKTESESKKIYTIFSERFFPPFEYLDEKTNIYTGFDIELLEAIAKDQGFEYELRNAKFDKALLAVDKKEADGVIAGISITESRKQKFDFSDEYFKDGQCIVVADETIIKSLADLKGKTVACKKETEGATLAEEMMDKYHYTLNYYDEVDAMCESVANGEDAACICDFSSVSYTINKNKYSLKVISDLFDITPYGMAVKKGHNKELLRLFNTGLENIKKSGKYDELINKYHLGKD